MKSVDSLLSKLRYYYAYAYSIIITYLKTKPSVGRQQIVFEYSCCVPVCVCIERSWWCLIGFVNDGGRGVERQQWTRRGCIRVRALLECGSTLWSSHSVKTTSWNRRPSDYIFNTPMYVVRCMSLQKSDARNYPRGMHARIDSLQTKQNSTKQNSKPHKRTSINDAQVSSESLHQYAIVAELLVSVGIRIMQRRIWDVSDHAIVFASATPCEW